MGDRNFFMIDKARGKDWGIAIDDGWSGALPEHRDARLRSDEVNDKHPTRGCIDVDTATLRQLLRRLPDAHETPLYILPMDEKPAVKLFRPSDGARKIDA